jgi:hypothetical protein
MNSTNNFKLLFDMNTIKNINKCENGGDGDDDDDDDVDDDIDDSDDNDSIKTEESDDLMNILTEDEDEIDDCDGDDGGAAADNDLETQQELLNLIRTDLYSFVPVEICTNSSSIMPYEFNEDEYCNEREMCNPSKLNREQREIYNYVEKNPYHIIVIQAGPGCGKSFCLKSISYYQERNINTIIYKKDLLEVFKYSSVRYTAARFFMLLFKLHYKEYVTLTTQLASQMSPIEFMTLFIALLKRSEMPALKESLIFIDEYTVLPKELLLILLMMVKYHKIGTILCGDKDQLENIHTSVHSKCSTYDVVISFADRVFNLNKNERCSDLEYNKIVNHFAQYSQYDSKLNDFAFAAVAAVFPNQLLTNPSYFNTHLATTHQELANRIHTYVINNGFYVDYYLIDDSKVRKFKMVECTDETLNPPCDDDIDNGNNDRKRIKLYNSKQPDTNNVNESPSSSEKLHDQQQQQQYQQPILNEKEQQDKESLMLKFRHMSDALNMSMETILRCRNGSLKITKPLERYVQFDAKISGPKVEKFVPYLPLVIGGKYYVNRHSDYTIGTLVAINTVDGSLILKVNDVHLIVVKETNKDVIFEQHYDFLKEDVQGSIYSYPIYPANFMSIHKCQGCTVTDNLDLSIEQADYRGLYVALSRVKNADQIKRISIQNQASHLLSAIVNFPELIERNMVTAESLQRRMHDSNYIFYNIKSLNMEEMTNFAILCMMFMQSDTADKRANIRNDIIKRLTETIAANKCIHQNILKPPNSNDLIKDINLTLVGKMYEFRNVFMALSCIEDTDRAIWLYEFIKHFPELSVNDKFRHRGDNYIARLIGFNIIHKPNETNLEYIYNKATLNHYIDSERIKDSLKYRAISVKSSMSKRKFEKSNNFQYDDKFDKELKENHKTDARVFTVLESTVFGRRVYRKLKRNKPITLRWLITELNEMLLKSLADKVREPIKLQTTRLLRRNQRVAYSNLLSITMKKYMELEKESSKIVNSFRTRKTKLFKM